MGNAFRYGAIALIAAGVAAPAAAQDKEPWRYRVTLGGQFKPKYPGADKIAWLPLVDLDRARGDDPFKYESPDESFSIQLIRLNAGGISIGPAANLVGKRKPEDVGAPVPKVDRTIELGAYAEGWLSDNFRLHGEIRRGVNGHEGWVGNLQADAVWRNGDKWLVSIGPRVTWADDNFHDAYFTVTPATALATGLPVYNAGSGIESVGGEIEGLVELSPRWGLQAYGKYERLVGDAADSPIVLTYGSRDQFSAGLGVSYSF